jgi:membrane protease subunit (stomatin/prohibitin family)
MGLLTAAAGAVGGVLADQWKEFFYCESMGPDILVSKGQKRVNEKRSSNTKASDNIISNGSLVAVNEGQFMMIVEQGKVVEFCDEPGEFIYDTSTEPSLFYGGFGKGLLDSFKLIGKRFGFGGDTAKDQRIYFFNKKEIIGNKYGTANPVPFRIVDRNIGLDIDIGIRCFGEYSYKLVDPLMFYANVCGNVERDYPRSEIDSQLKSELLTALQPAFAKISTLGIRYSALPGHTMELADALNEVLSEKWSHTRGIAIASFGVSSVTADEEDENRIKQLQQAAALKDPTMAAATLASAQAQAMQDAAKNEGAGAFMAFAGMNVAGQAGGANIQSLYGMGQQQAASKPAAADSWTCACGATAAGNFCQSCGAKRPASDTWTCACGATCSGNFCQSCGAKRP